MARSISFLLAMAISLGVSGMPAAEPDVAWPEQWVAFGPVPARYGGLYGFPPPPEDMPSAETLKTIPSELVLAGR